MPDILVVDDEASFRRMVTLTLRLGGYHVRAVGDGVEALAALRARRPDAVVLDLSMPRLGGWEVLRRMRDDPVTARIPVVIISANADEETRRRTFTERVDQFILKPVTRQQILEAVLAVLAAV